MREEVYPMPRLRSRISEVDPSFSTPKPFSWFKRLWLWLTEEL
jgi:hypothetical protein